MSETIIKDPRIAYGPFEGRERWYHSDGHIKELEYIAMALLDGAFSKAGLPVENVRIWYDNTWDFHILSFDLRGNHYDVEYYKVFTVTKNRIVDDGVDIKKRYPDKTHFNDCGMNVWDFFLGNKSWGDFSEWEKTTKTN